jgi:hypothetical protein
MMNLSISVYRSFIQSSYKQMLEAVGEEWVRHLRGKMRLLTIGTTFSSVRRAVYTIMDERFYTKRLVYISFANRFDKKVSE